MVNEFGIARS
jgi:hypothetical protein